MSAGQDFDCLGQLGVAGDGAVLMSVGPNQVGQHPGVASIRLGLGGGMPVPVAADRQWVDGVDLVTGGEQGLDQQAAVDLDADHHLPRFLGMLSDQLVQPAHTFQSIGHAAPAEKLALLIQQAEVMVGLRPVHSKEDHLHHLLQDRSVRRAQGDPRRPNRAVLEARHPTGRSDLLTSRRGHALPLGLPGPGSGSAHPSMARMTSPSSGSVRPY